MKLTIQLSICLALLAAVVALSGSAFAGCSSCMKEGDWSASANAFISGQPMSEDPIAFGPKAARTTDSQFENQGDAASASGSAGANGDEAIILMSINASPSILNTTETARISATFARNSTDSGEGDAGTVEELEITATAVIRDSMDKEVAKLSLLKTGINEYSRDWSTNVPTGVYSVDITATSLEGAKTFPDAVQIEVL